jgi:radical SAM superfamily enzyme YgiQ (UPF0313 family)
MELPRRSRGDELLRPGALLELRRRLRGIAPKHDLATVIACAFDHRTRMLPFIYADTRMAPAGVRGIGSAMVDSGFTKTRIVLQQWNKRFKPSRMQLDGRVPDLFMVSSMGLHSQRCMEMIRDARQIAPEHRPLIIAGGPHAVYQPYELFSGDRANPTSADVVVTGEEYVLLEMLEVLLAMRRPGEPMRAAFMRARDAGALDGILGLVYGRGGVDGAPGELVDTGVQRLVGDLDELPDPVLGYRLLEAPSRRETIGSEAVSADRVRKLSPISSIVLTFGCKFACQYCPIPAYNQRQHRLKSPGRIAEEMHRLNTEYGLRYFFGADDNFFNHKQRTLDIVETLARAEYPGAAPLRKRARWHTEVTVHDTLQMKDHLPLVRESGCRALWLGVEDMTATLVNKGQSVSKTQEAFTRLRDVGICPMPMMMHHDSQPLYSRKGDYGLLNQIKLLRKAGAVSLQVLMMTPSAGTKLYEGTFSGGQVLDRVGGRKVLPHMYDGNYVVASGHKRPWRKQLNLLMGYLYFYNPVWFVAALLRKTKVSHRAAGMQVVGMLGLTQSFRRTSGWALRLMFGKIERLEGPPQSALPMHGVDGSAACHGTEMVEVTISAGVSGGAAKRGRAVALPVAG